MPGFDNDLVYAANFNFSTLAATGGQPSMTSDGQLIIGTTALNVGGTHVNIGTLTSPDTSITIGFASPNITLKVNTAFLFKWQDVSGAFISNRNNGYFITATASSTLPAGASEGDTISYIVDTTQFLTLTASGGQVIRLGNNVTAAAGTAVSTFRGDALTLVFRASDQAWIALSSIGTWNLT